MYIQSFKFPCRRHSCFVRQPDAQHDGGWPAAAPQTGSTIRESAAIQNMRNACTLAVQRQKQTAAPSVPQQRSNWTIVVVTHNSSAGALTDPRQTHGVPQQQQETMQHAPMKAQKGAPRKSGRGAELQRGTPSMSQRQAHSTDTSASCGSCRGAASVKAPSPERSKWGPKGEPSMQRVPHIKLQADQSNTLRAQTHTQTLGMLGAAA
jgi:hypothetical protein